jgi:hypothetical protein
MKHGVIADRIQWLGVCLLAWGLTGCATGKVEEAAYVVVKQDGDFEMREYAPQVVAEVRVEGTIEDAGNAAFRPLFRYISGHNRSKTEIAMTAPVGQEREKGEKIPMTAPVAQQAEGDRWIVTFMMPAGHTLQTLPEPLDEQVRLRAVPAQRMAAVRYSGRWTVAIRGGTRPRSIMPNHGSSTP